MAKTPEVHSLPDLLAESIRSLDEHQRTYAANKLVAMNAVADAIVKAGPNNRLDAFHFAMHGTELGRYATDNDTEQIVAYRGMEDEFRPGRVGLPFCSESDRVGAEGPRASLYFMDARNFQVPESSLAKSRTGIQYSIEKSFGAYWGKVFVPALVVTNINDVLNRGAQPDIEEDEYVRFCISRDVSDTDATIDMNDDFTPKFGAEVCDAENFEYNWLGNLLLKISQIEGLVRDHPKFVD